MKRLFFVVLLLVLICGSVISASPTQAQGWIEYFPMFTVCAEQAVVSGDIIVFSDGSYMFACVDAPTPETVDVKTQGHLFVWDGSEKVGCIIQKLNKKKFSMVCSYSPPPSVP